MTAAKAHLEEALTGTLDERREREREAEEHLEAARAVVDYLVGERLQRLGTNLQVLVVTHSPQVAARGAYHWRVAKSLAARQAVTRVEELDDDTRQEEIARMLSGRNVTAEARAAAASLIAGGRA